MSTPRKQQEWTTAETDEVRRTTDLVNLIAGDVKLQRRGVEYAGLCPFHKETTPSFTVRPDKGFYHCFGCGAHGDAIGFLMRHRRMSFSEAMQFLTGRSAVDFRRPPVSPVEDAERSAAEEKKRLAKIEKARKIWHESQIALGTLVEKYLQSRGITLPPPVTLRFHPSLYHAPSNREYPAMIAAVQNAQNEVKGIHRTFIKPDGSGKAPVESAKMMLGDCYGGHVRFARAGDVLAVAEGIETALSVIQVRPDLPVWASMTLGNLGAPIPETVKRLIILADADNKDQAAAEKSMRLSASKLAIKGRDVRWCFPPAGMDFNDLLLKKKADKK